VWAEVVRVLLVIVVVVVAMVVVVARWWSGSAQKPDTPGGREQVHVCSLYLYHH
jgi:flagellar basal body-associated protein FliL